ncbi:MAG TPA: hypothetical protein VL485_31600 [Ktedonobacteraceae bacterium]|jgi:hypothetical protein|nr:hypothetical protein [Ktedonobacteraceae bacterium]
MATLPQILPALDKKQETGTEEHPEVVEHNVPLELPDPVLPRQERNHNSAEASVLPQQHVIRPIPYPAWPTSKPGPLVTPPPPGSHPHSLRSEQMVYEHYDQVRGQPGLPPPPALHVRKSGTRGYHAEDMP